MGNRKVKVLPLNRVEGDLEINVEMSDGVVSNARCAGIMYRGFENIMIGRAPLDALVITPRICGICSTSHLYAAARTLDMIYGVAVPPAARRIRNIALAVEQLQNDIRHTFLLFASDFCNPAYRSHPLYESAVDRYAPLKGKTSVQTIRETADLLEIIAIIGGQWPHSSFMVPGGVFSIPSSREIFHGLYVLEKFRKWYEGNLLGCEIEKWLTIRTKADLMVWLQEKAEHTAGDVGFFIQFALENELDKLGRGCGNFISYGIEDSDQEKPDRWDAGPWSRLAGIRMDGDSPELDQQKIAEDVSHAWFSDKGIPLHPSKGRTVPYASGSEDEKYSWAKAPRYDGNPFEVGPLAEALVASDPLFTDIVENDGPSVFARQLARLTRACRLIPTLEKWLQDVMSIKGKFYREPDGIKQSAGFGLVEAPRGALGHWVTVKDEKIANYQVITPTAWNASPRDNDGNRGPMEEALTGTRVKDEDHPVELYHVVRSFDPCLVCTVHAIDLRDGGSGSDHPIVV